MTDEQQNKYIVTWKPPETGDGDKRYAWSESFTLCSIKFVPYDCFYVLKKVMYKRCDFCEVPGPIVWEIKNE